MKNMIFIILLITAAVNAQVDRTRMPAPGPAPDIKVAEAETFTLPNGLKVFVVENRKIPRITYSLIIDRDPVYEGNAAGYIQAFGELMRSGTKNRTKDQLDSEIDFIGASVSTSSTAVYASSLTKHTHKLLELVSDIILNPVFPQDELQKIKLRMKSDIAALYNDPSQVASRVSDALTYGKDHPYGELVTDQTIDNITAGKCREYYSDYFRPNAAYLAVVGDINKKEAEELVTKYFTAWEKGDIPKHTYELPRLPEKNIAAVVDRQNAVQSVINITYPVELKTGSPDAIAATAMNTLLGGGVFRLFINLREKHAYTYGAYSNLQRDEVIGKFTASADVRNAVTDSAVMQMLYEMRRLRDEKVDNSELNGVKNYLTGTFALSLEDPSTVARFAINIERYKLPSNYYSSYLKNLENVTPEDIHSAAKKYLKPDNSYIVVVGSRDEIAGKLGRIAELRLFNADAEPVDTAALKIPEGVDAQSVIQNYIDAIGGRERLANVKDRTTVMTGTVQGFDVKMTIYQKAPSSLRQEVSATGLDQVIIYNGKEGVMKMGGNSQRLPEEELNRLKYDAIIGLILNPDSAGVKMELEGMEVIGGNKAYKIKNSAGPDSWYSYYDIGTGLKVLEVKEVTTPSGTFNQEIRYSDYREVDGIKYPFSVDQKLGPQEIDFNVGSIKLNQGLEDSIFEID